MPLAGLPIQALEKSQSNSKAITKTVLGETILAGFLPVMLSRFVPGQPRKACGSQSITKSQLVVSPNELVKLHVFSKMIHKYSIAGSPLNLTGKTDLRGIQGHDFGGGT